MAPLTIDEVLRVAAERVELEALRHDLRAELRVRRYSDAMAHGLRFDDSTSDRSTTTHGKRNRWVQNNTKARPTQRDMGWRGGIRHCPMNATVSRHQVPRHDVMNRMEKNRKRKKIIA